MQAEDYTGKGTVAPGAQETNSAAESKSRVLRPHHLMAAGGVTFGAAICYSLTTLKLQRST